jgi:hypothetical protein
MRILHSFAAKYSSGGASKKTRRPPMRMISKIAVPVLTLAAFTCAQNSFAQNAVPAPATSNAPTAAGNADAAPSANAQAPKLHFTPGTVLPVELGKSVDAKKAKQGDAVVAKIDQDLLSNGKIVIPRSSKVVGHVAEAKASSHDDKSSMLGIVFDKVVGKDGAEIPLSATVQGIGAPLTNNGSTGSGGGDAGVSSPSSLSGTSGNSPAGSSGNAGYTPSGAATGSGGYNNSNGGSMSNDPQNPMPRGQNVQPLPSTFQGVSGLKGLSLSQGQNQDSVIASQDKNVKLETGTQILLRTK